MAPLIGTQLSTVRGREVPDDPTSFAKRLNQPVPITLNTSSLSVVPRMPTKISPFSLDVPYLPPLPEYQKTIEPFNVPIIPSTYSPSPTIYRIVIHPSEPHLYTSNSVVKQAEGTQQEDVQHAKVLGNKGHCHSKKRKRGAKNPMGRDLRTLGSRPPLRLPCVYSSRSVMLRQVCTKAP
ncbi:uncharacterized protein G2W53_032957 [Senna tora]|uniref:Uncharacterized protein n=1 Tax=Senna tora TaxID=362788 RepID=A0A834T066_9FABA|nr:uncharacterized protein G2W53_032957 [Senna tora]